MSKIFATRKRIYIGRLVILLISSLLGISFFLFYTNYIDRDIIKKGSISKKFWSNIYYTNDSMSHLERGSFSDNRCHFMLNPSARLTYWGNQTLIWPTKVNINKAGFRDYEYLVDKPEGVFRIAVLGDSLIFGLGVNLEDTFPKVLERMLNKEGKRFEVLNGGLPDSAPYFQNLFFKHTLAKYDPDMIILFYSSHDYNCFNVNTAYEMSSGSYLKDNAKRLSTIWEALKNDPTFTAEALELHLLTFRENIPAELIPELLNICIKMPLLELKQNIECKDSQLIFFVFDDDSLNAWTIFEYVKNLEIPVVYNQEYINILKKYQIYAGRDNHLTVEGHRLMGKWLYDYLEGNDLIEKNYRKK